MMERTKHKTQKIPTCVLTSDWHLREDQPTCRTDNFLAAQWKKVDFVSDLQKEYDCMVIHSGDLYESWKPSPNLLSETIKHLPDKFYTIYGNHDLPQHNLKLAYRSGVYTLATGEHLKILKGCHWGETPERPSWEWEFPQMNGETQYKEILLWHVMTYQGKKPWPGCSDPMAAKLLRKYPEYDLIVTGHNHQSFTEEYEGRLLVNPGSLTRHKADQMDHKPCVYLWYAKTNTVEPVYLPIQQGVISREHIECIKERDDRIDAFISKLDDDWEADISFEENLERFEKKNNIRQSVIQIVHKAIEA